MSRIFYFDDNHATDLFYILIKKGIIVDADLLSFQTQYHKNMYIILGANGHVGSALAETLLKQKEKVTVIIHNPETEKDWKEKGAEVAITDVYNTEALRDVFRKGKRLFLLNPPANPSTDTVTEEHKTLDSILQAIDGSGLEKIVAESTYGAQPGEGLGDLGVLYDMEQALAKKSIPSTIIRAAYYMSNWDASLATAQKEGVVHTLYPINIKLPMVAPHDIGQLAAKLITEPAQKTGLHYMEGPSKYSSADVAAAFSKALQKPVKAVETPKDQWLSVLQTMGFSEKAAKSMADMTDTTIKDITSKGDEKSDATDRGNITLEAYIQGLVDKQKKENK